MTDLEILKSNTKQHGIDYVNPVLRVDPAFPYPRFGYKTSGIEGYIIEAMHLALRFTIKLPGNNSPVFNLLEIGTGVGWSTTAFHDWMKGYPFAPFRLISCDLPSAYNLNVKPITYIISNEPLSPNLHFYSSLSEYDYVKSIGEASIVLAPSHELLLSGKIPYVNFVFVDGCHGYKCVFQDFIDVNALMIPGGIIAFHDADPRSQGQDMQVHCSEPIRAREAIMDLLVQIGDQFELLADISAMPDNNGAIIMRKKKQP